MLCNQTTGKQHEENLLIIDTHDHLWGACWAICHTIRSSFGFINPLRALLIKGVKDHCRSFSQAAPLLHTWETATQTVMSNTGA